MTADRALGTFGISVGTDAALEKVIDKVSKNTKAADFKDFTRLGVSLATLIRNAQASLNSQDQNTMMPSHIAQFAFDDIQTLSALCNQANVPLQIIWVTYEKLNKTYSFGSFRIPTTTKQLFAKDYMDSVISILVEKIREAKKAGSVDPFDFHKLECTDPLHKTLMSDRTLYLTSNPVDLLESKPEALLQSYKSEIVPKWEFYKLYSKNARLRDRDFSRIPFNRLFIQIFGDAKTFYGRGYKELERIMDVAEKRDWNQNTTRDRIKLTLESDNCWDSEYGKVDF